MPHRLLRIRSPLMPAFSAFCGHDSAFGDAARGMSGRCGPVAEEQRLRRRECAHRPAPFFERLLGVHVGWLLARCRSYLAVRRALVVYADSTCRNL
jgi:hypothetical protein